MGKEERRVAAQRIGARIRKRRKALKLSGFAVADAASVSRYHYYVIERGEKYPHIDTLERIATALGVSLRCLMFGKNGGVK
jgi:transcriptional regulator with XRE-family HTH domain